MQNNTPNNDSIYYNALPYYQDRLDLASLRDMMDSDVDAWIRALWKNQSSRVVLNVSATHLDKVRRLYFEVRNFERINGARALAMGFPILIDTNESDLVFSPLFLFQLWLEPVLGSTSQWILEPAPAVPVQPNYRLLKHLNWKYGLDLTEEANKLIHDFSASKLEEFCSGLSSKLHIAYKPFDGVEMCPGIDEIGSMSESGALSWTAVLGVYPPQDQLEFEELPKPETTFVNTPLEQPFFLPVPLNSEDLETANALNEIANNRVIVVKETLNGLHRPLVVNLVLNLLSEGKRCLVISPFSSSLVKIQEVLAHEGLFQLNYLIDDPIHDAKPLLELVRTTDSSWRKASSFDVHSYNVIRNKYHRLTHEISLHYEAGRKPIFGTYSWSEVVGLWMRESRQNTQDLLGSHLNPSEFKFVIDEYNKLGEIINQSEKLFGSVKTLNHPLAALNARIFTQMESEQAFTYVAQKVEEISQAANQLQKAIIGAITNYSQALRNKLEATYRQVAKEANHLLKTHDSFADRYGSAYLKSKNRPGRISLFLSRKMKEIAEALDVTSKLFRLFVKHFNEHRLIEFDFSSCNGGYFVACVEKEVRAFLESLRAWHKNIEEMIKDQTLRLNHKTAEPLLDPSGQIREVEEQLDQFIAELNEELLFEQVFENKTLTLPQRQKYLETIIGVLESVKLNLRDFESFYLWQRHWISLSQNARNLVGALVKVKPNDWVSTFKLWYLNQVLLRNLNENQPNGSLPFEEVTESWTTLRERLIPHVLQYWQTEQEKEFKRLKKSNSNYHKLIFGRSKDRLKTVPDLRLYFTNAFECLTAYFPLLLATPHTAKNILCSTEGHFDAIIFTDADRLPVEVATIIAGMGQHLVICGRKEELGAESSLISYAVDNEVPVVEMNGHLQSISQALFREGNDVKTPLIEVNYVGGRFDELEETNYMEAQQVVKLLNQTKPNEKRVFPSIGVIAFTRAQRHLIQTQLLKLKQENSLGSEKILQLERNGLAVYSLDELFGQQFDELIVSCAYGMVDNQGKFTRKISRLNTVENVQALKCLTTQQAKKITILHSLPGEVIKNAGFTNGEKGLEIVNLLLTLANAQKSSNKAFLQEVQAKLGLMLPRNSHQSLFLLEIKTRLSAYLDDNKMALANMPPGLHKPLFVKPKIVVQQDGFFSRMKTTFGPWEEAMQKEILKMGLELKMEWAAKWFEEPRLQERHLASFILKKLDSEQESIQKPI